MPERVEYKRRERKTKTPEQAFASLMRLCSRAEKSSGDALRLMAGWGVDPAEARNVLDKLIKERFVDDRRYADAYVREKSGLNGWGAYKIRRMLGTKGIAPDIINSAIARIDKETSGNRLADMLQKKMRSAKAESEYELKGKLMRYGLSLGYGYDEVTSVIEEILKNG